MKFGVQLYGPLTCMQGDSQENRALDHLRALAAAGVTEVEPCVNIGCAAPEAVVWPIDWLMAHADEIAGMGLTVRSVHLVGSELAGEMDRLIPLAEKLRLRQYVVKTPLDAPLQQAALNYMRAADLLAEIHIGLLLHNEAQDIQMKAEGVTAYERLLDLCMGKVGAQVDVGWVQFGGEDPVAFLRRNAWRVKSLHHKDFPTGGAVPADIPIGTGGVDLAACFRFAQHRDIPQIIDQEHFGPNVPQELAEACRKLNGWTYSRDNTVSYLNTYDIETGEVKTLARFDYVIEAPNWLRSDVILYNANGHMYAYDVATGQQMQVGTGLCDNCNNDHVPSPDEKWLAVSHTAFEEGQASRVYVVPLEAEFPPVRETEDGAAFRVPAPKSVEARLVTPEGPSYLHGWSPDGKELAYCAFREVDGKREVDVYAIPAEGGKERRLTDGGFNDGPEYSPDGKTIWYNSTRSGLMQIWRMDRDGSGQAQITNNCRNNWFGHVSPDGRKVAYLSYGPEQLEAEEHLPNMPVEIWLMDADGGGQRKVLSLFGGQGSMNVNSWAGDSRRFAFVSYEA